MTERVDINLNLYQEKFREDRQGHKKIKYGKAGRIGLVMKENTQMPKLCGHLRKLESMYGN